MNSGNGVCFSELQSLNLCGIPTECCIDSGSFRSFVFRVLVGLWSFSLLAQKLVVALCDANGICVFCQWHSMSHLQMTWKTEITSTVFNNFNTTCSSSGNIIFVSHKLSVVPHYESRNLSLKFERRKI